MVETTTFDPGRAADFYPSNALLIVQQAGALCLRDRDGVQEVLLISGLRTGSWGIPKGHVEDGELTWETVEREAFEEAGVVGTVRRLPMGGYFYSKSIGAQTFQVCVHCVDVLEQAPDYPEKNLRRVEWVPLETAVRMVTRRGLRRLLQDIRDGG